VNHPLLPNFVRMRKTVTEIPIRGYHADQYGHVNNARYLEFLEEGRWHHYEGILDQEFAREGWAFVVVNINISYRHPAVPGDTVSLHTQVSTVNSRSMVIHQDLFLKGSTTKVAQADVTFVILDTVKKSVVPLEGRLLEILSRQPGPHDVA
jgi:thioesterase III